MVGPFGLGQVAVLAVAALIGLAALYALRDWLGLLVALLLVGAALAAVTLPIEGRTAASWAPIVIRWGQRRG